MTVVVTGSRQFPNQPHELHVVVMNVVVEVAVDDVVSSRHPHQPGVLHVSVRVKVEVVDVAGGAVPSDSFPLKNFQAAQSTHSVSCSHTGK